MGDGRGDFQKVWHEFVGDCFHNKTILDVGAGIGLSKARLAKGHNEVTTQDVERSLLGKVDLIEEIRFVEGLWDIVTAFDVIEHVPNAPRFLVELERLAAEGVFFTTPAYRMYPHPWHFTPDTLESFAYHVGASLRFFARYKCGDQDTIEEITRQRFFDDPNIYAHGIYIEQVSRQQEETDPCPNDRR